MTRNGVEYDLKNSPYKLRYNNIIFYFSSELHMRNFSDTLSNAIERNNEILTNRYRVNVCSLELGAIRHYIKKETRGFYITIIDGNGEEKPLKNLWLSHGP